MEQNLIVRNEDDAFKLLVSISKDTISTNDYTKIIFEEWPVVKLVLYGEQFHGTFSADTVKFVTELQSAVYRSYAILRYGVANTNKLTDEEKKKFLILFQCSNNCSTFEGFLKDVANKLIEELVQGMDSKDKRNAIIISILILTLGYGGVSLLSTYMENQKAIRIETSHDETIQKMLEAQEFANQQETNRAKIIADIAKESVTSARVYSETEPVYRAMVKTAQKSDKAEIAGKTIYPEIAKELLKSPASEPQQTQLNGNYHINKISDNNPLTSSHKIEITSSADQSSFSAVMDGQWVSQEQKGLVFEALKNKDDVFLKVNARIKNGEVIDASIIEAGKVIKKNPAILTHKNP